MNTKKLIISGAVSVAIAASIFAAVPVFAQSASKMANAQSKGSQAIDQRVTSLTALLSRIQDMKNVSVAAKAAFVSAVQTEINELTALKGQIAGDTSTTTLKTDVQSITQAYRIYALIIPQINIIAASDRILTIVSMMNTLGAKMQARLASSTNATGAAAAQAALTDFASKIIDANTQAQNGANEVVALGPDGGDKTKMASNTAALKDGRSKVKVADADLVAARKDADTIVQSLKK